VPEAFPNSELKQEEEITKETVHTKETGNRKALIETKP
jgi:hypothetical protein